MLSFPVPSWLTKSPPCKTNPLMTRWKVEFLYPVGCSCRRNSPVQNCRKFSQVLGQSPAKSSILIRPRSAADDDALLLLLPSSPFPFAFVDGSPRVTSKKTTGFPRSIAAMTLGSGPTTIAWMCRSVCVCVRVCVCVCVCERASDCGTCISCTDGTCFRRRFVSSEGFHGSGIRVASQQKTHRFSLRVVLFSATGPSLTSTTATAPLVSTRR
mmetsp:Transcript_29608/g.61737  ORF Transcript_29608/g.61737 Transcript_29608/m.61737 type:complete len:212 (+) Transcript_29608:423-1058(+)